MGSNFNLNKVILGGRLTAQPELKQTQSGVSVTSFRIAVNRHAVGGKDAETDFFTVTAWRQTAEFICKYFSRGSAIIICGSLQTRSWKDADGKNRYITVLASEAAFAESKKSAEGNTSTAGEGFAESNVGADTSEEFEVIDDDLGLPF